MYRLVILWVRSHFCHLDLKYIQNPFKFSENTKARYDNYRLYRVHLGNDQQLKVFQELETRSDSYVFYGHARVVNQSLTIMVAAHKIAEFVIDILEKYDVQNEMLVRVVFCTVISFYENPICLLRKVTCNVKLMKKR